MKAVLLGILTEVLADLIVKMLEERTNRRVPGKHFRR